MYNVCILFSVQYKRYRENNHTQADLKENVLNGIMTLKAFKRKYFMNLQANSTFELHSVG